MSDKTKAQEMDAALLGFNKTYKDVRVTYLSDESIADTETISTGSLKLDKATGVGGFARGRASSIFGWSSCGKTTIALQAIAEAHAENKENYVAFIDAEQALDKHYAASLGVDMDRLVLVQPDTAEQALEFVISFVKSNIFDMIILDSIAALSDQAEMEGSMSDNKIGKIARLMSMFYRKLIAPLKKSKTAFVAINQYREKITLFGDPRTLPGGHAEKFYSTLRIELSAKSKPNTVNDIPYSISTNAKIVKNKLAAPYREAALEIIFSHGTDKIAEAISMAISEGIIERKSSWFSYDNTRLQGEDAMVGFIRDNPDYVAEIIEKLKL